MECRLDCSGLSWTHGAGRFLLGSVSEAVARRGEAALCRLSRIPSYAPHPILPGHVYVFTQNLDCVSETNRQLTEEREDRPEPRTQDHKNQPRNDLQGKASATAADGNNYLGHSIRGQPGKDWKDALLSTQLA